MILFNTFFNKRFILYVQYNTLQVSKNTNKNLSILDKKITVWSSPAPRCQSPAQLIAQRLNLSLHIDPRIYEFSFYLWGNFS